MRQSSLDLESKPGGPVECLGQKFPSEEARREHYLKLLAQKLKDPEFRKIEGFPIGKDEDILALSDPPYYTACPNPWLGEFIKGYGTPYDPGQTYHREPFAADVSEGKNHPIYNAHSYHTKVPHRAIMRYLLHYTQPGDLVFDGFCGTGMTGVAAQLCGDLVEVQELGYRVQNDGTILNHEGKAFSKLGARHAILKDLSPAASFIAYNYNSPINPETFEAETQKLINAVERNSGWMYSTLHQISQDELSLCVTALSRCKTADDCRDLLSTEENLKKQIGRPNSKLKIGRINYVVWSDVFLCPESGKPFSFWSAAVDPKDKEVYEEFKSPHSGVLMTKRASKRAVTKKFDRYLNEIVSQVRQDPVFINYFSGRSRFEKASDDFDSKLLAKIEEFGAPNWIPTDRMPEGDEARRNDEAGLTHVHHFFTPRNLAVLSDLRSHCSGPALLVFQSIVATLCSRLVRYNMGKRGNGPLSGTLYVSSLNAEADVLKMYAGKLADFISAFVVKGHSLTETSSATSLNLAPQSLDYIFIDPPFGSNLPYSALNFIWEAWNKVVTQNKPEATINSALERDLPRYQGLMLDSFRELYKALKPGRWMTVEFSNSQASVWNAIQTSLQEAGFVVANVAALDKQQGSFKAVTTTTAVKQDLVISAYKPNGGLEDRFAKRGETEEGVWDFTRTHLKNLPVVKARGGQLEFVAERDPRILYDRMVAFYVGHSTPVPLSSAEFQAGLAEKFPERDGMVFLPEQVNEYDKKRAQVENIGQLSIFVEDERSAINWLRNFLKNRPSVSQDIQPEFMQQLSASWKKWEARPEMSALLDQNFLCYGGKGDVPSQIHGYLSTQYKVLRNLQKNDERLQVEAKNRWYVPDPKKNVDVETLRNKRLIEEFWSYLPEGYTPPSLTANKGQTLPGLVLPRPKIPKGKKLKELRTEAVRVGFKHCYQKKDYATILVVAELLPESVLNEDEQLQMIYDTAVTRSSGGE
jgi:DNA modification methylase